MGISIPKKPENIVWTGMEQFPDANRVYCRFEDHAVSPSAPDWLRIFMEDFGSLSKESYHKVGHGRYGLYAPPWLAEYLFLYTNCMLTEVTTAQISKAPTRSRYYVQKRFAREEGKR